MSPQILAVIPARYASTRFPGKPLAKIDGRPMVQWVYEAARGCSAFQQVCVATDDLRIARAVDRFGGQVEMTRADHATGTDRVAEVAARHPQADVVVNVQGDQPFVTAEILRTLVAPFHDPPSTEGADTSDATIVPEMATVACPLPDELCDDPHAVKVVCDQAMNAIYFSRAPIPFRRHDTRAPVFHHLGLYAFRRAFLDRFQQLEPTPLEACEGLEQLRAIEHGYRIRVGLIERMIHEVNVPADLERANALVAAQSREVA